MDEKKLSKIKVKRALTALRKVNDFYLNNSLKKSLFNDGERNTIYLELSLKKIPSFKTIKMIKVPLPNPLINDTNEICLITGDLDKNDRKAEIEPTILKYKSLLKKHNISNIEIVPLRQLRTEYKTYESKRYLLGAYDKFLADRKIAGCLPKLLGKHFFKKRKFPIQIELNTSNLNRQINSALSCTVFYVKPYGTSCTTEIAHLGMEDKQIMQNVVACFKILKKHLPGGWKNILGLYLRTVKSVSIPIYLSYDNFNNIKLNDRPKHEVIEAEEISTLKNKKVKILADCSIKVINVKIDSDSEEDEQKDIINTHKPLIIKEENMSDDQDKYSSDDQIHEEVNKSQSLEWKKAKSAEFKKNAIKKKKLKLNKDDQDKNSSDDQIHEEGNKSQSLEWKKAKSAEFKKNAIKKKKIKLKNKDNQDKNSSDDQIHKEVNKSQSLQWKKAKSAEFKKNTIKKKKIMLKNKDDPDVCTSDDNDHKLKKKVNLMKEKLKTSNQKENNVLKKKKNVFKDNNNYLPEPENHISSNQKDLKRLNQEENKTLKKKKIKAIKDNNNYYYEPEKQVSKKQKHVNTVSQIKKKILKKKNQTFDDNEVINDREPKEHVSLKQKNIKSLDEKEKALKKKIIYENKPKLSKKHKLDESDLLPQKKKKVLSLEHDKILKLHKIDEHLQMDKEKFNQNSIKTSNKFQMLCRKKKTNLIKNKSEKTKN